MISSWIMSFKADFLVNNNSVLLSMHFFRLVWLLRKNVVAFVEEILCAAVSVESQFRHRRHSSSPTKLQINIWGSKLVSFSLEKIQRTIILKYVFVSIFLPLKDEHHVLYSQCINRQITMYFLSS